MFEEVFPRKLTEDELEILFKILPAEKEGYRHYRELISLFFLSGNADSEGSFILTRSGETDSYSSFLTPVFAAGSFNFKSSYVDLAIHEESLDTIIFSIEIADKRDNDRNNVIYSDWIPGKRAPGDNSSIREVPLQTSLYTLVIAPVHKKLWLFDHQTGVNHFLNPGAFYNNLCITRNIRDSKIVFNSKLLFLNLDNYSDYELISAFHLYNKTLRKFRNNIPEPEAEVKKQKLFQNILKKDKN